MNKVASVNLYELSKVAVFDEKGESVLLSSLWQKQPAILIFLRHFACIGCRSHAQEVWAQRDQYQKNGAKIYFIGNGNPYFIQRFKEDLGLENAPVYTDPSLKSFAAAGFKRGFLAALGPKSVVNGVSLLLSGARQTGYSKDSGDLWQLGGILVVRPNGTVAYQFISEALGDFPPENDVSV